jgi:hypothetical protein
MASALDMIRTALSTLKKADLSADCENAAIVASGISELEAAIFKMENIGVSVKPVTAAPQKEEPKEHKQVRFEEPPAPAAPQDPRLKAIAEASREQLCAELEIMDWPEWVLYDFTSLFQYAYGDDYLRAGLAWFVESTGMFPSEVPAEKQHLVNYGAYFRILSKLTPEQFATDFRCAYRNCYTKEELMKMDLPGLRLFARDWMINHKRLPFIYKDLLME